MHRGQDYFSHYAKGYRWAPFRILKNLGFGHIFDFNAPDEDVRAWQLAQQWTNKGWLKQWNINCNCKKR